MTAPAPKSPATLLLNLARRTRRAEDEATLRFILVNETYTLAKYQIALLWVEGEGVVAQSGVSHVERHSPFVSWSNRVCQSLSKQKEAAIVTPVMLETDDAQQWSESLPSHALWIPISGGTLGSSNRAAVAPLAGLLLAREDSWSSREQGLLTEWSEMWSHAWKALHKPSARKRLGAGWEWLRKMTPVKRVIYGACLLAFIFFPVRLTILAQAELVPADPAVIRVPIEGVVDEVFVTPNQRVKKGQPLFKLDMTSLTSKMQVAQQEMQIALAEYRQSTLQSLTDAKSRGLLTPQEGRTIERQLEADYLKKVLEKAQVTSPREGVVIFDDPLEWIGKPVMAGEKVMMVASEGQMEIEVWVPLNEAIELDPDAAVAMYLKTAPFAPVSGTLRYLGHEAVPRPDGTYAYRMRARITDAGDAARIGLRGTAKVAGDYVPFSYWVLRKPIVALRQFVGL
ncbi:efflux RND transporter periplasmic adaptor subunit [Zwartia sp.]|uniref:efflux RND transporter periplasmic adaptor subunit n=1 Tax=Zwartia sp. TaxID=2978004 RepID=UPI0027171C07|nr:HlyD family efflux transporter periplasmic adaptor subunit [Zwartia sp.]MDO9023113.1 HlyD family efflux transporter periplasmic adaptor subunit [Zwartia sp.]